MHNRCIIFFIKHKQNLNLAMMKYFQQMTLQVHLNINLKNAFTNTQSEMIHNMYNILTTNQLVLIRNNIILQRILIFLEISMQNIFKAHFNMFKKCFFQKNDFSLSVDLFLFQPESNLVILSYVIGLLGR